MKIEGVRVKTRIKTIRFLNFIRFHLKSKGRGKSFVISRHFFESLTNSITISCFSPTQNAFSSQNHSSTVASTRLPFRFPPVRSLNVPPNHTSPQTHVQTCAPQTNFNPHQQANQTSARSRTAPRRFFFQFSDFQDASQR